VLQTDHIVEIECEPVTAEQVAPGDYFHYELAVEQRAECCMRRKSEIQTQLVGDKAPLAHRCQLVAAATVYLYRSVNCPMAWCFALEAVYGGGDGDDDDKLV